MPIDPAPPAAEGTRSADAEARDAFRPMTAWDGVGLSVSFGSAALVAAVLNTGSEQPGPLTLALGGAGLVLLVLGVVAGALLVHTQGVGLKHVPRQVFAVWINPPRPSFLFLLGILLTVPLLATHTRLMTGTDADSALLAASVRYVQRHGLDYLVQSQENLLPHVLLGPALSLGGIGGAMAVSILSVQFLAGSTSYVVGRLTSSPLAAIGSVAALLAFRDIPRRGLLLPMYGWMLAFGLLGVFLAWRATRTRGRRGWLLAVGAGAALIASIEAQTVGQLFVPIPLLLLVLTADRGALVGLARVYGSFALLYVPRAAINLAEGGTSFFLLNRVDYWITKGYLVTIQKDFGSYPIKYRFGRYVSEFGAGVSEWMTPASWFVLAIAVVAVFVGRGRGRWFGILVVTFLVAAMVYQRIPPFERYLSPLMLGSAIATGLVIAGLRRARTPVRRASGLAVLLLVLLGGAWTVWDVIRDNKVKERAMMSGPLPRLAKKIDDGKGVIGARPVLLNLVDPDIQTYGGRFLPERAFVTFLTWPSDEEVVRLMRARDIGWVFVQPDRSLEIDYNDTWIEPEYGLRTRHLEMLATSESFCLESKDKGYLLYRLGGCAASGP